MKEGECIPLPNAYPTDTDSSVVTARGREGQGLGGDGSGGWGMGDIYNSVNNKFKNKLK